MQSSICRGTSRAGCSVEEGRAESRSKAGRVHDLMGSPTGPHQEEQNRSGDSKQGQPRVQIARPVHRDCSPTRMSRPWVRFRAESSKARHRPGCSLRPWQRLLRLTGEFLLWKRGNEHHHYWEQLYEVGFAQGHPLSSVLGRS